LKLKKNEAQVYWQPSTLPMTLPETPLMMTLGSFVESAKAMTDPTTNSKTTAQI
jgi:hypothetical protein